MFSARVGSGKTVFGQILGDESLHGPLSLVSIATSTLYRIRAPLVFLRFAPYALLGGFVISGAVRLLGDGH